MAASKLQDLMKQVDDLPVDDQLRLLSYLAERARLRTERPAWCDLRGAAPDLLEGEDAQEWVSRTRKESCERREALLGQ